MSGMFWVCAVHICSKDQKWFSEFLVEKKKEMKKTATKLVVDNFCYFLFAFSAHILFLERALLQKEGICSPWEQILSF